MLPERLLRPLTYYFAPSRKRPRFGARRTVWFALQAARTAEMKRIWRPLDVTDFQPDVVLET